MKLYYYSCAAIIIAAVAAIPVASGQFTCTFSGASDESSCIQMEDEANQHCVWCALDGNNHRSSNNNNNNNNNNKKKKKKKMKMNQEIFEMKKLIQTLEAGRGDGMSMISLIVPPGDQFSRVNKMLSDEYAVARVMNRPKILSALTCTQQRLKRYSNCPPNGLVVYCGTVVTEDGTEQNVSIDFEPFLPINTSLYLIDNTFHTEDLSELLLLDDHNIIETTTTTDFGFCVSEVQAETIEQITPELVHCDRYSGTDDAVPTTDDTTPTPPTTDDAAPVPTTDDRTPSNTDDATPPLPDNYWQCLNEKDEDSCTDKDCTWCDTPVGYGVCMTGPSAEAAETSKWFTCKTNSTTITTSSVDMTTLTTTTAQMKNPMDPSCVLVYLEDPSMEACEAAVDAEGTPCEFCSFQDALQLCLNIDQAEMGEQFGLECGSSDNDASTTAEDPLDPSCALVYLQDPTKEACEAAVDVHGIFLFCSLQDAFQLCLNVDQAAMGEQYGIECNDEEEENVSIMAVKIQDPLDPSCALIFLQDPSPEACEAATDADGNPCEFCSLPGSLQVCLNAEQAEIGEQFGLECGDDDNNIHHHYDDDGAAVPDQTFPDDLIECLEHYQENDCRQSDCTWCNTQVGMGFCVTLSIAETTKPFPFFDCEFGTSSSTIA